MKRHPSIDKSVLAIGTVKRERDRAYLDWIMQQRCCVPGCGRWPSEPHHLLTGPSPKSRGLKESDGWCIPCCAEHHRGNDSPHGMGDERAWALKHKIDVVATAEQYRVRYLSGRG